MRNNDWTIDEVLGLESTWEFQLKVWNVKSYIATSLIYGRFSSYLRDIIFSPLKLHQSTSIVQYQWRSDWIGKIMFAVPNFQELQLTILVSVFGHHKKVTLFWYVLFLSKLLNYTIVLFIERGRRPCGCHRTDVLSGTPIDKPIEI
jgi:hypothetical protein